MAIQKLKTVFSTGAWINSVKTFYTKINEIIDYLNTYESNIEGSYTEYRALITQSGTSAPVEDDLNGSGTGTAFIDTLGGVWSYNDVGSYYYTKTGAFADAVKIEVVFGSNEVNQSPKVACRTLIVSDDVLEIQVGELGSFANPAAFIQANSKLYLQPISIRVYA